MVSCMKAVTHTCLVIALVLLAGCATTFRPWKLSEVQEGMDRIQVVQILGEPDFVETKDGAEFLHYTYSEGYNPAPADNDVRLDDTIRDFRDWEIKQSVKEYKYVVKLVDGKVQSYEELQDSD